jgi:hypothetical protein
MYGLPTGFQAPARFFQKRAQERIIRYFVMRPIGILASYRADNYLGIADVLLSFYLFCMWKDPSERTNFVFMVKIGLRRALSLIQGMKKSLTEDQQRCVAETIVHELESYNWKIEQGPPARPPG